MSMRPESDPLGASLFMSLEVYKPLIYASWAMFALVCVACWSWKKWNQRKK